MAEKIKAEQRQKPEDETPSEEKESKGNLKKIALLAGGSVIALVVVLTLAYVLATAFIIPKYYTEATTTGVKSEEKTKAENVRRKQESKKKGSVTEESGEEDSIENLALQVYLIEDIVVNPAGTNGSRFLALSVGFGVADENVLVELENKEVEVIDGLIGFLSKKTVTELADTIVRIRIKEEIRQLVNEIVSEGVVHKVYFTKYVLQ